MNTFKSIRPSRVLRVLFVLFAFSAGVIQAQKREWTLEECVTYAVENNLDVQQFQLAFERTMLDKSDAIGNLLPAVNAQTQVGRNVGFTIDPSTNAPTTAGITTASANLTASMTLFDGLRNINQLQRAKMNALASQYQLQDLVDDIRLNVANAYLNVLSNKESLKAFQAQYAVTEQDLNRIREQVDAGVLPRGDLLEIQATAANLEQQIVNAENNVLLSRIVLAQLLQITDYENFDIADQEFEVPPSEILGNSPKVIFDKALTFRNDIAFSRSNVELAEQDLKIARGAYLPSLNAFFNYNTRYSSNTTLPDPANPGSFFSPTFIDQLWILDGISYGARLDVPIFNGWSTRNNVKRAKIDVMRAELQLEQDKLALENDINTAYLDVQSFAKAYEAAQKTLEARQLALEYARERYEVGLMNAFDYGQAQARVDDAQASVIQNKYNYIFRLKVLEFYFGLPITLD
ncbi:MULTISPECIES: TolC family protein [Robiginitalea]|uniref:Putative outer membrane transport/efflux protein n=1 Tax=Robiginitalea biformata (strain ATCC BAA-864 / DSM 15991 / KCTC 12146 / HTCC2501) TaxID=313596 RepID=A4CG73_ROBBH|nr:MULTISPECIES: TolC family protein [Robiginitalea]EAR15931.1 putative outer membrane transport/efflux protein [Robiginitalea biformata HTCC2501]MDC6354458.1 TolC family protein [Robiginitalea sp. PM2]MDC6374860.1 TolC family protein [Robiginitalea sp. SP8]